MTEPRSCLASAAAAIRDPDPVKGRREARAAWHRDGLVLINPSWLPGWAERRQLENLAERVHGKRRA